MNRIIISLFVYLVFLLSDSFAYAEHVIRKIVIQTDGVFSSQSHSQPFGATLAEALHTNTKYYIIEDELLFSEGEYLDENLVEETERNLRQTGLFSLVKTRIDTLSDSEVDIYLETRDQFSLLPSAYYSQGGNAFFYGARVIEKNLGGWGTNIDFAGTYFSENDIRWQGEAIFSQRRLFRSELWLDASILKNRFQENAVVSLSKPFRTIATPFAFQISGTNNYGNQFYYSIGKPTQLLPFHEQTFSAWAGVSILKTDRFFSTIRIIANNTERISPLFRQALDNTGGVLLGFSSLGHDFRKVSKLNGHELEDMPIGAWGTAAIGRFFPLQSGVGEQFFYAGGQIEQSTDIDVAGEHRGYLFGQASAGSGFAQRARARYTYQEFLGLGFWQFSPELLLAARFRQQTSWNWFAFRQLILDNDGGLRGYGINQITGDNRIIGNVELRVFPDWQWWIIKFSGALFYDIGSAWNQGISIDKAQFHHSIGAGIRFHNTLLTGANHTIRLDFAYNVTEQKFGQIILSVGQLFSAFGKHQYSAPKLFGEEVESR